jgi:glycosyltransferase involved in cell wall biosynthesis
MKPSPTLSADSRVIFMTYADNFGGAERSVVALANWLHHNSLPHHFLVYTNRLGFNQHVDYPLTVHEIGSHGNAWKQTSALRKYFSQNPSQFKPLVSGYQPALHATLAGQRGFHTLMHDTPSMMSVGTQKKFSKAALYMRVVNPITAYGLRSGGQTIVTSEYLRDESLDVFGVHAAIARMGGMVNEPFRLRRPGGELHMLSTSRIEDNKRIDWMVRSLATMEHADMPLSRRINWRLDVVGKGSQLETLRKLAASAGLADRILFRGFVSDEELGRLYAESHLFLMPARQGYGIPAVEALQRGIPVLLHRESGVSDILLDTPWATVIDGGEENLTLALEHAITSVIEMRHAEAPLPHLPTEAEWAERVATLCGWV